LAAAPFPTDDLMWALFYVTCWVLLSAFLWGSTAGSSGSPPMMQSAWNPADANVYISISTTTVVNDTAAATSNSGSLGMLRGTLGYAVPSSSKKVLTIKLDADTLTSGDYVGLSNLGSSVNGVYPGQNSPHSFGVQDTYRDFQDQLGVVGSACAAATTPGVTLWFAIDFNTGKINCSINCTTWLGSGNPDGSVAPYTLSTATYYPAASLSIQFNLLQRVILNTKPSLGGCSNISTFSQWG
jgi:hypothetical protein